MSVHGAEEVLARLWQDLLVFPRLPDLVERDGRPMRAALVTRDDWDANECCRATAAKVAVGLQARFPDWERACVVIRHDSPIDENFRARAQAVGPDGLAVDVVLDEAPGIVRSQQWWLEDSIEENFQMWDALVVTAARLGGYDWRAVYQGDEDVADLPPEGSEEEMAWAWRQTRIIQRRQWGEDDQRDECSRSLRSCERGGGKWRIRLGNRGRCRTLGSAGSRPGQPRLGPYFWPGWVGLVCYGGGRPRSLPCRGASGTGGDEPSVNLGC